MGFECALAIVMPTQATSLVDRYPPSSDGPGDESEDIFVDRRVTKAISGRAWEVVKFLDFGRVRTLVKPSSSLSIEERAGKDSVTRAANCTASFLLEHIYTLERIFFSGSTEYTIPFVADHILYCHHSFDQDDFLYRNHFTDVFEYLGSSDVVTGLWSFRDKIFSKYPNATQEAIVGSIFWRYNCALLNAGSMRAFFEENNSLLWDSAFSLSRVLTELLHDGGITGDELRKDTCSATIVTMWRDTLRILSSEGARCIFLTDSFHTEAHTSMRLQSRYL